MDLLPSGGDAKLFGGRGMEICDIQLGMDQPNCLREESKERRLEGCDPLVSPLASGSLSQTVGRCIASAAPAQNFKTAALAG